MMPLYRLLIVSVVLSLVCVAGAARGIEQELRSACRRAGFPYKPRS